jgi:hypothetical protein
MTLGQLWLLHWLRVEAERALVNESDLSKGQSERFRDALSIAGQVNVNNGSKLAEVLRELALQQT